MQTIAVNDLVDGLVDDVVSASFEACVEFAAAGDGSPVCASCGWLAAEHASGDAEVHALPQRGRARVSTPKRLAS